MRSELVFTANDAVSNRFLLCRIVSISTRKFHGTETSMHETINTALKQISGQPVEQVIAPPSEPAPTVLGETSLQLVTDLEFGL